MSKKLMAILAFCLMSVSALASAREVKVTVKGMVCGFCAQGIEKKFSADPAVSKVDVNLGNHLVTLNLKDAQTLSNEKITDTLKASGYTVEKIERN